MANLNFIDEVKLAEQRITNLEELAGKGLLMPNNPSNSGSRKIMFSTQIEHVLSLLNPEAPLLQTGYEDKYGEWSSAFYKASTDYEIIYKIDKFSFIPDHHYYLIVRDKNTGIYDIIERVSYNHITESYGYLYNNKYLDSKQVGEEIRMGDTYKKSTSFNDLYDNRQDGVNLVTGYLSCEYTKEDGIIISETAAKKLAAPLIKKVLRDINDNDIPLNIYGDLNRYKSFPDINEEVKDGILCALRREKKEESLFSQSIDRLGTTLMSDETTPIHGKVIDINIYCNNPEGLEESYYNSQIKFYYDEHIRFLRDFCTKVGHLINSGCECSYDIQKMYYTFTKELDGGQFLKDNKPFSNIVIEFIVLEESKVEVGDKISNRYGGKGIVSAILPDELMPELDNGQKMEVIFNSSTCVNRENAGQLIEMSLNFSGSRIIEYITSEILDLDECIEKYLHFIKTIVPEQYDMLAGYIDNLNEYDKQEFLTSIMNDDGIILSMRPISECIGIDQLAKLYSEFPEIKPYKVKVPQRDSRGNIRYIETRRRLVVGKQYIYRLKQYAEEKFSVVSLSATNIKNENSRNTSKKNYKSIYAKTPIRFGEMESGDLAHLGVENVIINLMLHSTSPHGRRLAEELLTGEPFDIDIKLDDMSKNRSVEILNAYFLTMGLELDFKKIPKKKKKAMLQKIMHYTQSPENGGLRKVFSKISEDEYFNPDYLTEWQKRPMLKKVMSYTK